MKAKLVRARREICSFRTPSTLTRWFTHLLFTLALVLGATAPASAVILHSLSLLGEPAPSHGDRILVKPAPGSMLSVPGILLGSTVLRTFPAIGGLQIVQLPFGASVTSAISLLQSTGLVAYAEPDFSVHLLATDPNDFRYQDGSLWGLHNTGQLGGTPGADIDARDAWDTRTSAANVIVAIVDTGIRTTHEDLAGNLWTNPAPTVGDVHGLNAIQNNGNIEDDHGHGSHVAGTIGAVGNNSVGVVGVAWKVQLMALKFLDSSGNGSVSDAITCIDYARTHGASVINASWGAPSFQSQALHDAIASARTAGIIFVAACGNSSANNDTTPLYPASYNADLDNIVAVAATDRNDQLASFSDYGANSVNLAAPGTPIFSCWNGNDSDYRYDDGTSMACALTSGAMALVRAQFPADTYRQVINRILNNVDPKPSLAGKTTTGGRLNLFRAMSGVTTPPPTPPLPPSNLAATATSSSAINLTWTDNANNEDGFFVERSTDNATFAQIASLSANTTSYSSTGLTASTTYYYRVRAFNSGGNSAYSNTANATTPGTAPTPPAAPTNLAATATSSSAINLTWTDNASNEDGFTVERSTDNTTFTSAASLGANATSYADTGLAPGATYYYRVRAFNAAGNSAYTNTASATTPAPPPPPTTQPTLTASAPGALASKVGPISGQFAITRAGTPLDQPLTVHVAMSGTAVNGVDYQTIPATATIAAGQSSVTITLTPIPNGISIGLIKTATLTVQTDAAYNVGAPASASITILDTSLSLISDGGLTL